ncbi:hypothetical protein PoB_007337900 [Plakobranchus ocellatus]|uniref:Uncharacterized protein n=1 Tax=Plakobranchus ocellatus TaxID=259542 RepID=A0AAV4DS95_9GAST|nr:hypothetical protein PoB_007337900 [Plakobranchus ocellatus]
MAASAINANEDIQIAIDSMAGNFQERFETFISVLKSSVSSSSRAQAEKIFLSAIPALSYKFPDPTGLANDADEENNGQSEVDSLKAEIVNLKRQQEKLERRVISEKQEVQNNYSSIEKKMRKIDLRLRENIAQLESNNKAHVEELSKDLKSCENNIQGLRKLQKVLRQRNQSPGATALPMSSSGAGATVTSKPLKDLRQRGQFSVRADGDQMDPFINDVKLLPRGLFVVTDAQNRCLKLFNIQGNMLHCLSCKHWPACLAVLDTSSTSSTLAVTLPAGQAIDILEMTDQSIQVKKSLTMNEKCRALAAVNNMTLAVGYLEKSTDIDIINLNGQHLCRIFPQLAVPAGVTMVSDDSLLVADLNALSLHLVSSGGQWLKQVWTALSNSAKDDKLRNVSIESSLCVCVTSCGFAFVLDAVY